MIENRFKHILTNARTYQGTLTNSDHRILIATMQIDWSTVHRNKNLPSNNKVQKFNVSKLIHDKEIRDNYKERVHTDIANTDDKNWNNITTIMKKAAADTIGVEKRGLKRNVLYDEEIESLSNAQKKLRIEICNTNNTDKVTQLRNQRNRLLK